MTEEYSDQINLLAKALNCKSNLVHKHYDQFGISSALDVRDSARLQKDYKRLETAWRSISIARVSINNLSAFEKGVMELEGRDLATELREIQDFLHETIVHREKLKEINSSQGGKNHKAHLVAEMVAAIFEELGRPINSAKTSGSRNQAANAPSSEFGKAVQEALRITHTSGRWKREQIESQDGQSTEYSHLPHADWQTPTEYAVRKHRHKKSKTKKV